MNPEIDSLIYLCNVIGGKVAYVQGGGGNISLKTSETDMYIKASGKFLADIKDETGFLPVNWTAIRDQIDSCKTEAEYNDLLAKTTLGAFSPQRPSIETGFHAILDRCTLHSHSVWVNLLTCAKNGEAIIKQLFPSSFWVPYRTPGLALTKAILRKLNGVKCATIFLQNHGVIVSGPDTDTALAMHNITTDTICAAYPQLQDFDETVNGTIEYVLDGLFFPDQAIYQADPTLANSRAGRETLRACNFLADRIPAAGLEIRYLKESERGILLNMDSEKHRQKLVLG